MKVLIVGDSHTGALKVGASKLRQTGVLSPDISMDVVALGMGLSLPTPFFADAGDHIEIVDESYRRRFVRFPPLTPRYNAIGLAMPLNPLRVLRHLAAEMCVISEHLLDRKTISHSVLKEIILKDLQYILQFIDILKRLEVIVFAIAAPGFFRARSVTDRLPDHQIALIFKSYIDIASTELRNRDCKFFLPPDDCFDSRGFMKETFKHPDPVDRHHGNEAFGALMIAQIQDWLCTLREREASAPVS